jgi:hypothetical protein
MRLESSRQPADRGRAVVLALQVPVSAPTALFRLYCGSKPLRFANRVELRFAKALDRHGVQWDYEPRTFVLERSPDGRVLRAFTPDFYLPEHDLFIEVTAMKQSRVARKNRKARELRERYPAVRLVVFYRRDVERMAQWLVDALPPGFEPERLAAREAA